MSTLHWNDLKDSYKESIKCADCHHLNKSDVYTDFWGKETYYCRELRSYIKLDSNICEKVSIDSRDADKYGSFTPSGCYITTIVCNILGYDDNCEILQILRDFRDNYLKRNPDKYLNLLMEYDQIGPSISDLIYKHEDRERLSLEVLKNFLIPCVISIKKCDYDNAVTRYQNMVYYLQGRLGIILTKVELDLNADYDLDTIGKGRILKPSEI